MTKTEAMNAALREANRAEQAELGWKRAAADLLSETTRANAAESALAEARHKALEEAAQAVEDCAPQFGEWSSYTIIAERIRALASGNAPEKDREKDQGALRAAAREEEP